MKEEAMNNTPRRAYRGWTYGLAGILLGCALLLLACPTEPEEPASDETAAESPKTGGSSSGSSGDASNPPKSGDEPSVQEPANDPAAGVMDAATADGIFTWDSDSGGVTITKFNSAPSLKAYINKTGGLPSYAAANTLNALFLSETTQGKGTFIIRTIDKKPVKSIAAGAFSPGGDDNKDITTVVNVIKLPETVEQLGSGLFAGVKSPVILSVSANRHSTITQGILEAAAGSEVTVYEDYDPNKSQTPLVGGPPVLRYDPEVSYRESDGKLSVVYTFRDTVTAAAPEGWTLEGDRTAVITLRERADSLTPGERTAVALTAEATSRPNGEPNGKTTTVEEISVLPVQGIFARPAGGTVYTVSYYDPEYRIAGLRQDGTASWYLVLDTALNALFNAVYTPNAPESTDSLDGGKSALPYSEAISAKVLALFHLTIGTDPAGDTVEVRGEDLSVASSGGRFLVIDLGLPGGPAAGAFTIPYRGLGSSGENYAHVWLRVNQDAGLVIKAGDQMDESGYLQNSTVEIMGGAKLREEVPGALGAGVTLLNRLNSYRANPAGSGTTWLLGPREAQPIIAWDTGDQNGDYFETRNDKLAFSANLIVREPLVLDYHVWFINGPSLTIDIASPGGCLSSPNTAHGDPYRFYGTTSESGGQNPSLATARIIIRSGSFDTAFLLGTDFENRPEAERYISAPFNRVIVNRGFNLSLSYDGMRSGFPDWKFSSGA
jgi:hypothetical protein